MGWSDCSGPQVHGWPSSTGLDGRKIIRDVALRRRRKTSLRAIGCPSANTATPDGSQALATTCSNKAELVKTSGTVSPPGLQKKRVEMQCLLVFCRASAIFCENYKKRTRHE